jgi:hypothetical protein
MPPSDISPGYLGGLAAVMRSRLAGQNRCVAGRLVRQRCDGYRQGAGVMIVGAGTCGQPTDGPSSSGESVSKLVPGNGLDLRITALSPCPPLSMLCRSSPDA